MSLPPKLLERLKKRGIIQQANEPQLKRPCNSESRRQSSSAVIGCPNKWNVYHDCTTFCELKFGLGTESPSPKIKQIYETLIEHYPLTEEWLSVWEPACARFYFYNTNSNLVSWYPPNHPKFKAIKSANTLRDERLNSGKSADSDKSDKQFRSSEQVENNKINEQLEQFDAELSREFNRESNGESYDETYKEQFNKDEDSNDRFNEDSNDRFNEDSNESNGDQQSSDSEQSSDENE